MCSSSARADSACSPREQVEIGQTHNFGWVVEIMLHGLGPADSDKPALTVLEVDGVGDVFHQRAQQEPFIREFFLDTLALECVDKNLADEMQLSDELFRPGLLSAGTVESDDPHHFAAVKQRGHEQRTGPGPP